MENTDVTLQDDPLFTEDYGHQPSNQPPFPAQDTSTSTGTARLPISQNGTLQVSFRQEPGQRNRSTRSISAHRHAIIRAVGPPISATNSDVPDFSPPAIASGLWVAIDAASSMEPNQVSAGTGFVRATEPPPPYQTGGQSPHPLVLRQDDSWQVTPEDRQMMRLHTLLTAVVVQLFLWLVRQAANQAARTR